ncbi:MAG: peptidoglycan synthetase [Bacteroidetes bacterium CG23_combo_of_CG06-09_8_20_14_all_32_9]|nr:MAG: peptidoglycan synthetase [Bacteroidetes bacterium CG23_combo_of_CG06-09_8_20_14_all_32_9]
MRVHFIAIGGSAMHNLALALHKKGYVITGSDDEIFEPSKSRLAAYGLLPEKPGWFTEKIHAKLDAVILGMHARNDNPELAKAKELGLKIFSYPEYLYEQSKDKIRIVIGGSHGKTTITSIIMHVVKESGIAFDYMVGAQVQGFDTMVSLSAEAKFMVIEGDEYLSSPDDLRPKFHLYHPHIALLSGIAWDHINVFPTFENYIEQFEIFAGMIEENGALVWYKGDEELRKISRKIKSGIRNISYSIHPHLTENNRTFLLTGNEKVPIEIFGSHNLENISGALEICRLAGISDDKFYRAISTFRGANKRLQKLGENEQTTVFLDFAHSPSKVKATINAVKEQFTDKKLTACLELHTFSSLKKEFLPQYKNSMNAADEAIVYYNHLTIKHKRLAPVQPDEVLHAFEKPGLKVFINSKQLIAHLLRLNYRNKVLLMMSSGNFDGIQFTELTKKILDNGK